MANWYSETGPESDVVVSTRVRLARNLRDFPFPSRMSREQANSVISLTKEAVFNNNKSSGGFSFIDMQSLDTIEKQAMVERHAISRELAESTINSALIISADEKISIMINEEDHLRIQCLFPGLQLSSAWELGSNIDSQLEKKIKYAFSPEYGYLTSCPTNVGTGIRASVMLHLPALVMTGYIGSLLQACSKIGIAVRGIFGENSQAMGNMFQISNQVTLGQSEEEIISGVSNIAMQIISQERNLRKQLLRENSKKFEDRVYRSFGILTNARIISSEESLKLLSDVKLGADMDILKDVSNEAINETMVLIQPASIQRIAGKVLQPEERDIKRAEIIRQKLSAK